jgi:hypothetical protein
MTGHHSKTVIKFLTDEEAGEGLGGWWILCLEDLNGDMGPDGEGYCWDAVGPYESEEEAKRILCENASD